MMYVRDDDLKKLSNDIRTFIRAHDDPPPSAPAGGWWSLSCGQRKTLIRFREFRPSTDIL